MESLTCVKRCLYSILFTFDNDKEILNLGNCDFIKNIDN